MKRSNFKHYCFRKAALVMAVFILVETVLPTAAYALTSGPAQPEYTSFEPVATTQMVNDFTGDFTYNLPVLDIPGPNGAGYAMSLSYHSGASPEEEASWVGYGWTLNPGVINRQKRGIPDDFDAKGITYYNKMPDNWTVGVGGAIGNLEAFSIDVPLSVNAEVRYNNYRGFSNSVGAGLSLASGTVSLGYNMTDGEGSFSVNVNPMALMSQNIAQSAKDTENPAARKAITGAAKTAEKSRINLLGSQYGLFSYSDAVRPTSTASYTGASFKFEMSFMPTASPAQVGPNFSAWGSFTSQQIDAIKVKNGYGYLYSAEGLGDKNNVMDYYTEKLTPYQKNDILIGLPFNSADNFGVSGEGISGGFRFYNSKPGNFRPNYVKNEMIITEGAVEVETGLNVGAGFDIGVGYHSIEVGDWQGGNSDNYTFAKDGDEFIFARFNNDLGGNVVYSPDDEKFQASINSSHQADILAGNFFPSNLVNDGGRPGRSSYIAYHTNAEMMEDDGTLNKNKIKRYTRGADVNGFVDRSEVGMEKTLGEIAVFNENGNKYTYGLPTYSRKEFSKQYSLYDGNFTTDSNFLTVGDITNTAIELGEYSESPYATGFLLTEITTPDYVDRKMDGPTIDDFGGYTKFNYVRQYGSGTDGQEPEKISSTSDKWYRWRTPYQGLHYQKNEMSDYKDDLGTVMTGEKEIYYVKSIETKTHIAYFVLGNTDLTGDPKLAANGIAIKGSGEARKDGIEADENSVAAKGVQPNPNLKKLQKLERIELYAKDVNGVAREKIKTVHFKYDYSLCPGLPNADASGGKLTLLQVWTEYGNVINATISPYTFKYQYPQITYPAPYTNISPSVSDDYKPLTLTPALQNPSYNAVNIDAWGNHQADGATRYNKQQHWLDQTPSLFDPAAWQLKQIILPSGGEIHVQYEAKDYHYVQDKLAMAMTHLTGTAGNNKFKIDVKELGVASDQSLDDDQKLQEVQQLIDQMNKQFVLPGSQRQRIYFKFYYTLLAKPSPSTVVSGDCDGEFIEGYARVKSVSKDPNSYDIIVELDDFGISPYPLPDAPSTPPLPDQICREFVKANRQGRLDPNGNCKEPNGPSKNGSPVDIIMSFIASATALPGLDQATICMQLSWEDSYFRVPMTKDKKGGGVRVKRLLMHDKGIETGGEVLFGSEYQYKTLDENGNEISSGVAVNEPSSIREENALVQFMPRYEQSFANKIIAGRDKKTTEGPIGESILPAPSVGYSRIIERNIHSGKTNTGYLVKEFFTAKDYPFIGEMSNLEKKDDWLVLPLGLFNYAKTNVWLSQGFSFKINSMHGQTKSVSTYSGDYNTSLNTDISKRLASQQVYEYFEPGEQIPFFNGLNQPVVMGDAGKEMDIAMERRSVQDMYADGHLEMDIDVGIFGVVPIPFVTAFPSSTYNESLLQTHATSKVTHYPAICKKVTTFSENISSVTEYTAFNKDTGKPMVAQTRDAYDALQLGGAQLPHNGLYTTNTFPASYIYKNLGQKAFNERKIITPDPGTTIKKVLISPNNIPAMYLEVFNNNGSAACNNTLASNGLIEGDLIALYDTNSTLDGLYTVGAAEYDGIRLYGTNSFKYNFPGIDVGKIEVIRSGQTNELNLNVGHVATYGAPQQIQTPGNPNLTQIADRKHFANALTQSLNGGGLPVITSVEINYPYVSKNGSSSMPTDSRVKAFFDNNGDANIYLFQGATELICSDIIPAEGPNKNAFFDIDDNGQLVFYRSDQSCTPYVVQSCIKINTLGPLPSPTLQGVISASAQSLSDQWDFDMLYFYDVNATAWNPYELGKRGKWRPDAVYAYKSEIIAGSKGAGNERIYKDAGVFKEFQLFNYKDAAANDPGKWLKVTNILSYGPHGESSEESDINNKHSVAKFGYNYSVPLLLAHNASYANVRFESFEKTYILNGQTYFEDGFPLGNSAIIQEAHTGKNGIKIDASKPSLALGPITGTTDNTLVKVWIKSSSFSGYPADGSAHPRLKIKEGADYFDLTKVAQTGEWALYQAEIAKTGSLYPILDGNFAGYMSYDVVDDVRIQPKNSTMTAYVYDPVTLKLIGSFDDQHFGLFYQYNDEGALTRKFMETQKGVITLSETQYHSVEQKRN